VHIRSTRSSRFPCLAPQQLPNNIVRFSKIREAGTVLVRVACGSLGREVLVKFLTRPFGTRSVDLAAIETIHHDFRNTDQIVDAGLVTDMTNTTDNIRSDSA
jgi:hypothetical protein